MQRQVLPVRFYGRDGSIMLDVFGHSAGEVGSISVHREFADVLFEETLGVEVSDD